VVKWCIRNKRVIITSDLDFGKIFYFKEMGKFGVIILRSKAQNYRSFIEIIDRLHEENIFSDSFLLQEIIIASQIRTRVYPPRKITS
jgi:hypothetical protein